MRIALSSTMAFIAGMAVMLAILLPLLPKDGSVKVIVNPHAGMQGMTAQGCISCHASTPAVAQGPALFGR